MKDLHFIRDRFHDNVIDFLNNPNVESRWHYECFKMLIIAIDLHGLGTYNRNITIVVIVLFYFIPTLLFVYSYGSIFVAANRKRHTWLSTSSARIIDNVSKVIYNFRFNWLYQLSHFIFSFRIKVAFIAVRLLNIQVETLSF